MSKRGVADVHGHLYEWVDATCWQAVVVGAPASSVSATPTLFYTLEEALAWVMKKPQFMLLEHKCIRAFKIPATGSLTGE